MGDFTSALFGSKPSVPQLKQLDLGAEQGKAISNNQANLPAAEKLVGSANLFSQEQVTQMLNQMIPNYSDIQKSISSNISQEVAGQIPTDVSEAVGRASAARSLGTGTAGSGMAKDLVARDLGLTSLDLTQRGLSSAESWTKTMASLYEPSMINLSSMFITPGQQASFDVEERNAQFERNWLQNQINAMPDPGTAGWWNFGWGIVDSVLGAYTGGNFSGMGKVNPKGASGGVDTGTDAQPGGGSMFGGFA